MIPEAGKIPVAAAADNTGYQSLLVKNKMRGVYSGCKQIRCLKHAFRKNNIHIPKRTIQHQITDGSPAEISSNSELLYDRIKRLKVGIAKQSLA